jgi:hypothetical protein
MATTQAEFETSTAALLRLLAAALSGGLGVFAPAAEPSRASPTSVRRHRQAVGARSIRPPLNT